MNDFICEIGAKKARSGQKQRQKVRKTNNNAVDIDHLLELS